MLQFWRAAEPWGLLGWDLKDAPKEDGQEESSAVGASPPEGAAQRTGKNWDGIAALRSTCSLSASTCSPPALANTSGAL